MSATGGVERPVYRSLPATLKGRTPDAARLQVGAIVAWCPRALLCTLTDRAVDRAELGDAITARVMVWKADELGWTHAPAAPTLPLGAPVPLRGRP